MSTAVALELRDAAAAAGIGLVPDPGAELFGDAAWTDLVNRTRADRVEGLLAAVTARSRHASEAQREEALDLHTAAAVLAVALERQLLEIADLFDGHSIDFRVLKGPAHAHLLYPDPALRSFGDVDVLVRGEQIETAIALLSGRGGRRRYPELRPGYDRRFSKGVAVVLPGGHEVDLHRTLAPGPFGLALTPTDLFERQQTFELAGRCLPALDLADQMLHACYHAVLGQAERNVVALCDVAVAAGRSDLDVSDVLERAVRWRGRAVVAAAVNEAAATLGLDPGVDLVSFARNYEPDARERRWLATYRVPGRNTARQSLASVEALAGWEPRGAYAVAVTVPETRGPISLRWRRGIRQLRAR